MIGRTDCKFDFDGAAAVENSTGSWELREGLRVAPYCAGLGEPGEPGELGAWFDEEQSSIDADLEAGSSNGFVGD